MSRANYPIKDGAEIYYIKSADEIAIIDTIEDLEIEDKTIKLLVKVVTRPGFGTKRLNKHPWSKENWVYIGEV